jgi:signal transduction histidine kinase
VGVGYKDDNLVLRVSQRFNLYILISLVVVVVVGGGLLAWLWWRLSRERRRRKALIQSRRYLTEGREKERERLAQEIHDGPVQALHGLHMQLKAVPEASDLEKIGDELMRVTSELRAMSANLHPPALQRFGLAAAIRSHADRLRSRHASLQIDMDLAEDCDPMPDEYALSLFRVAQEAMNNAVQHGAADSVHVALRCRDGAVTLDVRDDGAGFTPPDDWHALARQDHYGLLGMRERAEAINATLDIESAPERGTHVQLQGTVEAFAAPEGAEDPVPVPA